jgi:hypothetical protein
MTGDHAAGPPVKPGDTVQWNGHRVGVVRRVADGSTAAHPKWH